MLFDTGHPYPILDNKVIPLLLDSRNVLDIDSSVKKSSFLKLTRPKSVKSLSA